MQWFPILNHLAFALNLGLNWVKEFDNPSYQCFNGILERITFYCALFQKPKRLNVELTSLGSISSRKHSQIKCVQKCRKMRGLGCVNQARSRERVTQPSPRIFLHICSVKFFLHVWIFVGIVAASHLHSDPACQSAIFGKIGKNYRNSAGTILHHSVGVYSLRSATIDSWTDGT